MKQEKLFTEFTAPTYEEWRQEAEALLKGAPFDKKMLTKTPEGIVLQPIYNQCDVSQVPDLPGFGDYVRGISASGYRAQPWNISQNLYLSLPSEFNKNLLDALDKGQTAVELVLDKRTCEGIDADSAGEIKVGCGGLSVSIKNDIDEALKGVEVDCVEMNVFAGVSTCSIAAMLYASNPDKQFSGGFYFDPLGELASNGQLSIPLENAYNRMYALADYNSKNQKKMGAIGVDATVYANAGANAVEELGFAFASAVSYIREMLARGMAIDEVAPLVRFRLSLGSTFFTEIAKIRAARRVWSKIIAEFGGDKESQKMRISARTSTYNKTLFDPYVNMLRATTEAFSGVVGGVESMRVDPFDSTIRRPDDFSKRIARNLQIILQEECNLCEVIDPAGGSYFVENLTSQIAETTWEKFVEIEKMGGMQSALESGFVSDSISATAESRKKLYDSRRNVVVGTNSYANLAEKHLEKPACRCEEIAKIRSSQVAELRKVVDMAFKGKVGSDIMKEAISAVSKGASIQEIADEMRACACKPLPKVKKLDIHRAVEHFEALRLASEAFKAKTGNAPKIFLATMGALVQHKARADFIRGFFEVGGFEVVYPKGFEDAQSAAEAFAQSGAKYAVICSTDLTYPELVPPVCKALKEKVKDCVVLLAGAPAPECEASYKEAGLDGSISIKSNNYETLSAFLKTLGVIE